MKRTLIGAIFAAPAVIAMLSLFGLIVALTGDGSRDAVSWIGLAVSVAAVIWTRRTRPSAPPMALAMQPSSS